MGRPRMHPDEVAVDDALVRGLLADQLPALAGRRLVAVDAWGTDHALFRLGEDLLVRLPIIDWAADQAEAAQRWLPVLAPHLPVRVPVPVAVGRPGRGYPFAWSVLSWLGGRHPVVPAGLGLAEGLAAFVRALRAVPTDGAPRRRPGARGGALGPADERVRAAARRLRVEGDSITGPDLDRLVAVWSDGVAAPAWDGRPVWVHADLSAGNLFVDDDRLTGVIDWGSPGVGDPAADLLVAWSLFDGDGRAAYRDALDADDAAWRRGRAWAVGAALEALPYYRHTNPDIVARSRRVVAEVLADPTV